MITGLQREPARDAGISAYGVIGQYKVLRDRQGIFL